ncbi:MAG: hypothetical protein EA364_09370 [Balneolaceae bacterium]|nr:MAG: hypothetical protein EA364_09370 [Balneolaceae bacterium]
MSRAASTDIDITSDMTELFFRDSSSYLEKQQSRIKAIVLKFVRSGLFRYNESRDVIQHVNERLLTGLFDKMQAQYNRSFKLQSYFSKIVCNLCLEFAKKEGRRRAHEKNTDFGRFQISSDESIMAGLVLREIYRHLDTLFAFYGRKRHRIELFFRILLRTGISERDVRRCYPHCSDDMLGQFLLSFEKPDKVGVSLCSLNKHRL